MAVKLGDSIIAQDGTDDDIFLILAGTFQIVVNGRVVGERGAGTHVGEMAAVESIQRRSATVIAADILMEPRDEKVKLPSDVAGVTAIAYRFEKGSDAAAMMAPAVNSLRDHIQKLGPNN